LKYKYKPFPLHRPHPAFPGQTEFWRPVINVALVYGRNNPSAPFECVVDTGCDYCLFHAGIGEAIGIDVRSGPSDPVSGLTRGMKSDFFFHRVRLMVAGDAITITAGFSYDLSVGGLLGQSGFFDHFTCTFDFTPHPPEFEVKRITRN
jgi:hypothetical protein